MHPHHAKALLATRTIEQFKDDRREARRRGRDRELERCWLQERACHPAFSRRVLHRLDRAAAERGDSWQRRTLAEMLDEIDEETLDIAGWGVLAVQLPPPADLPPERLERVRDLITRAADLAAAASLLVHAAQAELERG